MRTRIIAVVVAAALAIGGGAVLVNYVRGSDERAFAGAKLATVLIVTQAIPAGTTAANIGARVEQRSMPEAYVATGAATTLADLSGRIAAIDLEPGEQILDSRFVEPGAFGASTGSLVVPEGLQEVSVAVDAQRVIGGQVSPGDTVGVFVSLAAEGAASSTTQLMLSSVLVTSVTAAEGVQDSGATGGLVLVGLAVSGDNAQKLIYAAEFGRVWFSKQSDTTAAPTGGAISRAGVTG